MGVRRIKPISSSKSSRSKTKKGEGIPRTASVGSVMSEARGLKKYCHSRNSRSRSSKDHKKSKSSSKGGKSGHRHRNKSKPKSPLRPSKKDRHHKTNVTTNEAAAATTTTDATSGTGGTSSATKPTMSTDVVARDVASDLYAAVALLQRAKATVEKEGIRSANISAVMKGFEQALCGESTESEEFRVKTLVERKQTEMQQRQQQE